MFSEMGTCNYSCLKHAHALNAKPAHVQYHNFSLYIQNIKFRADYGIRMA